MKDKKAEVQVLFVAFKNQNFHQTTDDRAQRNLPVLELFINGVTHETVLTEPISFAFKLDSTKKDEKAEEKYICVYWDEKGNWLTDEFLIFIRFVYPVKHFFGNKWNEEGLTTINEIDSNGLIKCETDHLSGFSILLVMLKFK